MHPILLAGLASTLLYTSVALIVGLTPITSLVSGFISTFIHLSAMLTLRKGFVRETAVGYVAAAWALIAIGTYYFGGVTSPSFTSFIVIVVIAGLLLGTRVSLLFVLLSSVVGIIATVAENQGRLPMPDQPISPAYMLAGVVANFVVAVVVQFLAKRSLEQAIQLARQTELRLKDRAVQLEAAAAVGTATASVHNLQELLPLVCTLISEKFGFYHVSIYLLDESGERVTLRASSSPAGHRMLEQKHEYTLNRGGIISQVALTSKPRISLDVEKDQLYLSNPLLPDTRSEIALPLVVGNKLLGVLDMQSTQKNALNPEDINGLKVLASQTAVALENAHLFDEIMGHNLLMTALGRVGAAITTVLDLPDLLEEICTESARVFGVETALIWLVEGEELVGFAGSGPRRDKFVGLRVRIDDPQTLGPRVVREKRPLIANMGRKSALVNPRLAELFDLQSIMGVPLLKEDHAIGALMIIDTEDEDRFSEQDIEPAVIFGNQVAIAIENALLFQAFRRQLEELTVLHGTSLAGAEAKREDELIARVTQIVGATLFSNNLGVLMLDEETGLLMHHRSYAEELSSHQVPIPLGKGVTGRVAASGKAIRIENISEFPEYIEVDPGTQSELCVPIKTTDKVIGVLNVESHKPNAYSEGDERLLATIAGQLGTAIEKLRLISEAEARSSQLARSLAHQEELDRLKNEFVQNVSHELRTPLAIVKGYAELLNTGELGTLPMDYQKPVSIIARRVDMLHTLVNDLTSILEAENRRTTREELSLSQLVRSVLADFEISTRNTGLTLAPEIDDGLPAIMGDPLLLRRAMDNLLSNALKFTPANGTITVRLQRKNGQILLEVEDTGVGIPSDQIERIFERFYQVDGSTTRRYGGTGLGLALVREIIHSHGGEVTAESQLGKGSRFSITLPLQPEGTEVPSG